jgi:hypothetical protein
MPKYICVRPCFDKNLRFWEIGQIAESADECQKDKNGNIIHFEIVTEEKTETEVKRGPGRPRKEE